MSWLKFIWPFGGRQAEAEKAVDLEFRAQLQEALLRQDDLREAAANMKRAREERSAVREPLGSTPDLGPHHA